MKKNIALCCRISAQIRSFRPSFSFPRPSLDLAQRTPCPSRRSIFHQDRRRCFPLPAAFRRQSQKWSCRQGRCRGAHAGPIFDELQPGRPKCAVPERTRRHESQRSGWRQRRRSLGGATGRFALPTRPRRRHRIFNVHAQMYPLTGQKVRGGAAENIATQSGLAPRAVIELIRFSHIDQ